MVNSAEFNFRNHVLNNPNIYGGNYHGYICNNNADRGIFFGRANRQEIEMMRMNLYNQPKEPSWAEKLFTNILLPLGVGVLGGWLGSLIGKGKTDEPNENPESPQAPETPSKDTKEPTKPQSIETITTPEQRTIAQIATPTSEPQSLKKKEVQSPSLNIFTNDIQEKPKADLFGEKFNNENLTATAYIEASPTRLGRDYLGELKIPEGSETPDSGEFPQELNMTYGNGIIKLSCIDTKEGIYETSAKDRQFKVEIEEDGAITMKAHNVKDLESTLNAHLASYSGNKNPEENPIPADYSAEYLPKPIATTNPTQFNAWKDSSFNQSCIKEADSKRIKYQLVRDNDNKLLSVREYKYDSDTDQPYMIITYGKQGNVKEFEQRIYDYANENQHTQTIVYNSRGIVKSYINYSKDESGSIIAKTFDNKGNEITT